MTKIGIMLVEDEQITALDLKDSLERLGYDAVATVSTGQTALEKAEELLPDLVLMDIQIKGNMDGVRAAQEIKNRFNIPVIFLTAFADDDTLKRARITEPYGYLLKPFEERLLHSTIEMALYRHQTDRQLKESQQWLATTLNSLEEAVIATDTQGYIKLMNPVAERLTGWTQTQALGQASGEILRIVHKKSGVLMPNPITAVSQFGEAIRLDDAYLFSAHSGSERPIDGSAAPIINENGQMTGVVFVFRDISQQKKAEESLRRYAQELQTRNEDLDAFAHTVAHDLKTPLAPLIGYVETLRSDYATMTDDEFQNSLQTIGRIGHKMTNIIDELLLLAQVRKTEVNLKPLYMESIVAMAQRRLLHMIRHYQAQVILPAKWPLAIGYGPWVEEIWVNYLSNGIKYGGTPPRLELGATSQADGMIRFWVRDNGPGIVPEKQRLLFEPFTQLNQVSVKGHGLGLSIVKSITEKLGGQVSMHSPANGGSEFSFTLPGLGKQKFNGR